MRQGRNVGEVGRVDSAVLGLEGLDDDLDVDGVPQRDHVEHEAESAQFFLLAFPVTSGEFAATAMADPPGEAWRNFCRLSWTRMRRRFSLSLT